MDINKTRKDRASVPQNILDDTTRSFFVATYVYH